MIPDSWRVGVFLVRGGHFDDQSVWRPGVEDPAPAAGLIAPVETSEQPGVDEATRPTVEAFFKPGTVMDTACTADRLRVTDGPYVGLWEVVADAQVWPLGTKLAARRLGAANAQPS